MEKKEDRDNLTEVSILFWLRLKKVFWLWEDTRLRVEWSMYELFINKTKAKVNFKLEVLNAKRGAEMNLFMKRIFILIIGKESRALPLHTSGEKQQILMLVR